MSIILAIETSCDDTSVAIFENKKLLSVQTATSSKEFNKLGGIVPEIAARSHEECINDVFNKCLSEAKIKINDITHIAYTATPGLPGSLHIGKIFAKTLSYLLNAKIIPIDHLMGHLYSYAINQPQIIKYPFLGLVISGGNTILYKVDSISKYEIINQTTDDALGEVLDKIGRSLKWEYPGGVSLDKKYDVKKSNLKIIEHLSPSTNFSFSGIKTFATNYINNHKTYDKVTLGSSCLKWCIDDIIIKLNYYADLYKINSIAISGGVAANVALAKEIHKIDDKDIFICEKKYCGDNAAMIGFYASLLITKK